jgi:anion-transporting  ArsA/GET3 family ATPase
MMTGTLSKVMGAQLLRDVQTFVAAMDSMFGGFRKRADATYKLLQANGTAFLVVAAPERDALREASYFVERLAAEDMPLAGLVLNRVHGSGAAQLTAERALAAAEALEDGLQEKSAEASTPLPSGEFDESAESAENLQNDGIVDQADGKAQVRETDHASPDPETGPEPVAEPVAEPESADRLAAGLLRLHAERMQLVARERRTRDRFVSVHPEVPMVDVAALPGDVHDLAGLREIGERLAAGQPTAA